MQFLDTELAGVYLVDLDKRGDERGFFARVFCARECGEQGLSKRFVQVNNSLSVEKATLRGMHYQVPPHAETKLVRCIRGALWDCVVDIRHGSPTFGQWFGAELTADNRTMIYVPKGFAHGFITLAENTEALYFVDEFYAPGSERGIRWDDPRLNIDWPLTPRVVSEKDAHHPDFDESAGVVLPSGDATR